MRDRLAKAAAVIKREFVGVVMAIVMAIVMAAGLEHALKCGANNEWCGGTYQHATAGNNE